MILVYIPSSEVKRRAFQGTASRGSSDDNEEYIRENNEKYEAGDITWFDKINEFSNLPGYEAEAEKTGVADNVAEYGRGVVDDLMDVDPESERYFATFRSRRGLNLPESYNSVALDHVSPVKNQAGSLKLHTFL